MPHKFNASRRHKFDKAQYRVINWAEYFFVVQFVHLI